MRVFFVSSFVCILISRVLKPFWITLLTISHYDCALLSMQYILHNYNICCRPCCILCSLVKWNQKKNRIELLVFHTKQSRNIKMINKSFIPITTKIILVEEKTTIFLHMNSENSHLKWKSKSLITTFQKFCRNLVCILNSVVSSSLILILELWMVNFTHQLSNRCRNRRN